MALELTNFRAIGFDAAPASIFVDEAGAVAGAPIAGARKIDCGGSWLSTGWCDLHVHVWHGGTDISVRPQQAGRATGVTAMADAGSAGEAAFHGLREYVIEPGQETIRAFLNIGSIGLVACNRVSELIAPDCSINVDRTLAVAEANRDVICGIKVRASGVITRGWGISPARIAKRVAEILDLPLMVHIGEPDPLIDEVLAILTPGDIVTHCFNGKRAGSIGDTPRVFALAKRLADEGVRMDIGHGAASFSFDMARRALAEGLRPFSISTDLHLRNIAGPVHDMATTMSKLLAVGLPLDEVVAAVTERPRPILGLDACGGLTPGQRADFTVFDLSDHREVARDSLGATLEIDRFFEPRMTVIGASVQPAARRIP
ncbi:amidohydrolase family protein [Paracoccus sp. (in: a-proteobacteria)]|uniref:amidohydrolase family protein n=1 Tax=Paracoccus sp. TaxID=267 RepID=UPI003A84F6F3